MSTSPEPHFCIPDVAPRFLDWLANRGGVAVWTSIDLSDPGLSISTPALTDGVPTKQPHWKVDTTPARIITDPNEIVVMEPKEIKRFHIAIRRGSQGMTFKVTDGGTRRIRTALAKAGEGAYYEFDYNTQEAIILVPDRQVPLSLWASST